MIIGFDIQSLQSTSKNRGIGRYNYNLLYNILKLDKQNFFKLFFNGNYNDAIPIEEQQNVELIKVDYLKSESEKHRTVNHLVQFIKYLKSDLDLLVCLSTFEGWPLNNSIINPYSNRLNCFLATIVFDFIPLHYPNFYLNPNPVFKDAIYKRLRTLYHSDILLCISEWTRADVINLLKINPDRVVNIRGGISGDFGYVENLPNKSIQSLKRKFQINEKFILYVAGIEFRKNIEKSIIAFSKLGLLLKNLSFVIVCHINDLDKKRLQELSNKHNVGDKVIFTGYISDSEINILYNSCDAFVFPSLMEGLGLPILEAMACRAPVIGSNTSSMREIIGDSEFMFNPENENEITLLMRKIISDQEFKNRAKQNSQKQYLLFSWVQSAKKTLAAFQSLDKKSAYEKNGNSIKKPRIAFFSPLPPKKSGISYYSATLLPFLSKYWDIDIFVDSGYICDDPFLTSNFKIYSYLDFEQINKQKAYDEIIYQIGNSDNHTYIFDMLKKYPGVVVLHDVFLSGIMYWQTVRLGKMNEFIEEAMYSHGNYGKVLVEKAQKNLISWDKVIRDLQMNKRVLDQATKVIIHSKWDKEQILKNYPELSSKIFMVHQFAPLRISYNKDEIKEKLGFAKNDFLICSFGFVAPTKKIDSVLKNIANFLKKTHNAIYVLVGESDNTYGQTIKKLVYDLHIENKVVFTEFIDETKYMMYIDACDVCISLRKDARAGTSAAVNHALGAGLPTIISDEDLFFDFPNDVVIKLLPKNEDQLSNILEKLYNDPKSCQILSEKSKKFIQDNLSIDSCVEKYVSIINNKILHTDN